MYKKKISNNVKLLEFSFLYNYNIQYYNIYTYWIQYKYNILYELNSHKSKEPLNEASKIDCLHLEETFDGILFFFFFYFEADDIVKLQKGISKRTSTGMVRPDIKTDVQ